MLNNFRFKANFSLPLALFLVVLSGSVLVKGQDSDSLGNNEGLVLDSLPSEVTATIEARKRETTSFNEDVASFLIDNSRKWIPSQTVRVAFFGGNTDLHRAIEEATQQITQVTNITLDFGYNSITDTYRTWSTGDTEYEAEIRVSFDQIGYFSLIGTDSIDRNVGLSFRPVGGRPYQRSLNLQGFDINRPSDFKRVTRHEFMHALGVHHEHQIPVEGCFDVFRWDDDPGYDLSRIDGQYVIDSQGRRPGIFTYLSGAPNYWPAAQVITNLYPLSLPNLTFQSVDRASIMLYRFDNFFYKAIPNPCLPIGNGEDLSAGDREGLERLYGSTVIDSLGSLQISVSGLPNGVQAPVAVVFGSRVDYYYISQSHSLSVPQGNYIVGGAPVNVGGANSLPNPHQSHSINVFGGQVSSINIRY